MDIHPETLTIALKIIKKLRGTTLDKIEIYPASIDTTEVILSFDDKNCYSHKPFYTIKVVTNFSIFYEKNRLFSKHKTHLYSYDCTSTDEANMQIQIEKLRNSVVKKGSFDVQTLNMQINFRNNYILSINYINSPNHEFTFGQGTVFAPLAGHGTDFIVKNNQLILEGWKA